MKLRQVSDSDIQVQGLPAASIAVGGSVTGSRIVTTGLIGRSGATALLDSDILVGVATNCAERFAAADDFVNVTARLGSLKVLGRKLPSGTQHPAYVAGSHISAPSVGTVMLLNVAADSGSVVHVVDDAATLKVTQSKLVGEPMFSSGTWKVAGVWPGIWEVV